jgi:hypothetical protein
LKSDVTRFKGFLIEVRSNDINGDIIGKWKTDVKRTKTLDCSDQINSAVTHHYKDDDNFNNYKDDDDHKFKSITFTWIPPVKNQNLPKINKVLIT